MAVRRTRARKESRLDKMKGWGIAAGIGIVGLSLGLYLYTSKNQQKEQDELEATSATINDDELRIEVEMRKAEAEDRARKQSETPDIQEPEDDDIAPVVEPEPEPVNIDDDGAADDEPEPEPNPTPEEPAPDATDDAEEPESTDEPEGIDTPQPADIPEQGDEPTPTKSEDATTGAILPTPAPEKTDSQQEPPAPITAYNADKSILGMAPNTNKEWIEDVRTMIRKKELGLFMKATEQRLSNAAPSLFQGNRINYSNFRTSPTMLLAMEFSYLAMGAGEEVMSKLLYRSAYGEEDETSSGEKFMLWALTDRTRPLHTLVQTFKLNNGDPRQLAYAIEMFYTLWKDTKPRDRSRYLNLMIACSLVHEAIAKSPGMVRISKDPVLSMRAVYKYFVTEDSQSTRLLADIKKLSISQLLHVVDVRLPKSEFDWVHRKISVNRGAWGSLYDTIEYMMERATQDIDPYKTYTFKEIEEQGGVCRDQAYYTAYTAKCKGIPAAIITGDGDRGPHAWVGVMTNDKNWSIVHSNGYKTGRFMNPCSGRMQHQSALARQDKKMNEGKQDIALNVMLLADYMMMLDHSKEAMAAAMFVSYTYPTFTAGWQSRLDLLKTMHEKKPLDKPIWRRMHADLDRYAAKNSELLDLMQEVEADYLMEGARDATKKSALKRSSRKIARMVGGGRTDLLLESLQRQAEVYAKAKDWHGLAYFYRQNFKEYANQGDIFEKLLRQYYSFVEEEENAKHLWKTLAKDADNVYAKKAYAGDFFRVKKDVEIMQLIAEAYRKSGDERHAVRIEKEAEKNLERSKEEAEQKSKL